jgi:prepilin-type N-terminal cleavage/methylation domain-containing protein
MISSAADRTEKRATARAHAFTFIELLVVLAVLLRRPSALLYSEAHLRNEHFAT